MEHIVGVVGAVIEVSQDNFIVTLSFAFRNVSLTVFFQTTNKFEENSIIEISNLNLVIDSEDEELQTAKGMVICETVNHDILKSVPPMLIDLQNPTIEQEVWRLIIRSKEKGLTR